MIAGAIVGAIAVLLAGTLIMLRATQPATRSAAASSFPLHNTPSTPPVLASPGNGATGTAVLPPEPGDAALSLAEAPAGITPAFPFRVAGAAPSDRARALECLSAAIYYEAASEPDDGQRAVAQVVLNRVRHPAFPATVCGVVYQGAEKTSGCQFSFACDGAMARVPSRSGWARATRVAAAALAGYVFAPVGLATHYHTYAVTPAWNRTLVMTDAIGAHFFHRWKGYWGTAAAFRQRYAGHEPQPGPPPRATTPIIALNGPLPVVLPITPAPQVRPPYRDSGAPVEAPPANSTLPESQILDRWKDSGKPLR